MAFDGNRVKLRVWGDYACFTRPEMKVERVSYDVITPSAARGILEAIYWKPQIRWVIERMHVLKPIRFTSLRRNEVSQKIPAMAARSAMKVGLGQLGFYVEDVRQQRGATLLKDVEYVIEARFEVVDGIEAPPKHYEMFKRRAEKGQCFHHPYFGCREFPAEFAWLDGEPPGAPQELHGVRDLGWMLHDIDFADNMTARFFRPSMNNGIIDVPVFQSTEERE